jgi:Flp pilus assembly protein TadD
MFSVLKKLFITILLVTTATIAQAQTGDVNLDRLSEAVQAINNEQFPRAEQLLNSVLATLPNDADALNLLGVVRAKQKRTAQAVRLFRRALASSPSHLGAHINLGELLTTTNRSADDAALGTAYREAGRYAEARLELERAIKLDANDLRANYQLVWFMQNSEKKTRPKRCSTGLMSIGNVSTIRKE